MQKSVEKNPLISEDVRITLAPRRKRNRIWEIDFLRGVCVQSDLFVLKVKVCKALRYGRCARA